MTRARWITSAATLLVLWLVGALVCVPRMERDLAAAAQNTLARQPALASRFGRLRLDFDGLQARLTGSVRTAQDRQAAAAAVRDLVRAPTPLAGGLGMRLNPVSAVRDDIEITPNPPGWLLLAAAGSQARLLGTAATDYEARDLLRSVQESWSSQGGTSAGALATDAAAHDEAASVSRTLRGVPVPPQTAQAHLAQIGQPWQEIPLHLPDEVLLAKAQSLGVSADAWRRQVLPALHELRAVLKQQQLAEAERRRQAGLPPGHLFIASRAMEVVLRGEVGTAAMKRDILDAALAVFAPRRVHDEIRVSPQRRPDGEFGPITTALLPAAQSAADRSLFLCLGGGAWQSVDWQIASAEQSWRQKLPGDIKPALLGEDSAALTDWLNDSAPQTHLPASPLQPSFITLALFDSKAILSGQIAEEALRAQLIAAARLAYSPRLLVSADDLHVRGDCQPAGAEVFHTLKSLPPAPAASSAGSFAIAAPGGTWRLLPVTPALVEPGGLAKSTQLPAGISPGLIEELSAASLELLRLRLANLKPRLSAP